MQYSIVHYRDNIKSVGLCYSPVKISSLQMKSLIAVLMFAGVALAAPGGYTGLGGVYKNMNQDADYMHHAKSAAKMAINLFDDESLTDTEEVRPARKAVYVPTFFTSVPQETVQPQTTRFSRNANNAQVRSLEIQFQESP